MWIPLAPEVLRVAMGAPGTPPAVPTRLFGGFPDGQNCNLDLDPETKDNFRVVQRIRIEAEEKNPGAALADVLVGAPPDAVALHQGLSAL